MAAADPKNSSSTTTQQSSLSSSAPAEVGSSSSSSAGSYLVMLIRNHPSIVWIPLIVFLVIAGLGIAIIYTQHTSTITLQEREATTRATETGQYFTDQLSRAMLPLFSLAQIIRETDDIWNIPNEIGFDPTEPGSLPMRRDRLRDNQWPTHRNVTGSPCVDDDIYRHFAQIASELKANADMDGILVAIELAPYAVLCLAYPLINTEDFQDGLVMDNRQAIGHDLLLDPARSFIAEQTVPAHGLVIAGPLTLEQCHGQDDCHPILNNTLIARLPIVSNEHQMTVKGETYDRWGFAIALINWPELVVRSGIFEKFESIGMDFILTKTDHKCNKATGDCTIKVTTLAETPLYQQRKDDTGRQSVMVPLSQTTNNQWELIVSYPADDTFLKYSWIPILIGFLIAGLTFMVLFQKEYHATILAQKQDEIIETERLNTIQERELNDFIAHEVRNPLSAAISACTFVGAAVNEIHPLKDEESRVSVREDIAIIDTSLGFINELLRNILDVHKVSTKSLVLEETPVGILQDLFDPVVAMLYKRDEPYEIIMECHPEDLTIIADKLRLQQVLLNLARNSTKFVEKGYIRLKGEVAKDGRGGVVLSVQDSGPGVPLSKREHLFSRYQTSLDKMNQGTGVGLNLCKQIVDVMEGNIYLDETFHSCIDDDACPGSSIVIELNRQPVSPDLLTEDLVAACLAKEKSGSDGTTPSPGALLSHDRGLAVQTTNNYPIPPELKILFVDDDRVLRKLAMRSIQKYMPPNWILKEASSGEAALKLVEEEEKQKPFDVIFLDQYMSMAGQILKGTDTAKAMRSRGVKSIICGLSANNIADSFHKAGADAFVIKPFPCKPEELRQTMRRILYEGSTRNRCKTDESTHAFTLSEGSESMISVTSPLVDSSAGGGDDSAGDGGIDNLV